MPYRALGILMMHYLLFIGFLAVGTSSLSIAQECCSEKLVSLQKTTDFAAYPTLEQELLALTNEHRLLKGLPPLSLDDSLTQIARQHSQGMADQGFISHSLPLGDLRSRMARAGYPHEVARENVASAPTIIKAQNALTESPGHERNILANDVTRVGIGIARCPFPSSRQLYITEIFASPREEYRAEMIEEVLVNRVDELRQNGAGTMLLDPVLEKLASRSLQSINMPYKREELQDLLTASAGELPNAENLGLSRVQANVQLLHNPKNLSIPNHAREGQARSYGAAVRQVTDGQNQPTFLVLTLIGITR
jgi:uncharacterized protein YkwD